MVHSRVGDTGDTNCLGIMLAHLPYDRPSLLSDRPEIRSARFTGRNKWLSVKPAAAVDASIATEHEDYWTQTAGRYSAAAASSATSDRSCSAVPAAPNSHGHSIRTWIQLIWGSDAFPSSFNTSKCDVPAGVVRMPGPFPRPPAALAPAGGLGGGAPRPA
jgi:hypothetical protein